MLVALLVVASMFVGVCYHAYGTYAEIHTGRKTWGQFGLTVAVGAVLRSEERRVGKECVVRVDLGGRRIIKKKEINKQVKIWGESKSHTKKSEYIERQRLT